MFIKNVKRNTYGYDVGRVSIENQVTCMLDIIN